jgi:hypothetical protein
MRSYLRNENAAANIYKNGNIQKVYKMVKTKISLENNTLAFGTPIRIKVPSNKRDFIITKHGRFKSVIIQRDSENPRDSYADSSIMNNFNSNSGVKQYQNL